MELLMLDRNTWNLLTVGKQMNSKNSFENKVTYKRYASLYICKQDIWYWITSKGWYAIKHQPLNQDRSIFLWDEICCRLFGDCYSPFSRLD